MTAPPAGILVSTHHVVSPVNSFLPCLSFFVLTRKETCGPPKAGALSRVFQSVQGAAPGTPAGAVLLRRDRGALRLSEAVLIKRRRTARLSGAEGRNAQAVAVTVLH